MDDIVRVVRVLEYVGPRSHMEAVLAQNAVKGTRVFGPLTIREAMLGDFPEVVEQNVPNPGLNEYRL
jgi:hypothetical protein